MLFLVILIIALGWAGWFWAWGRDRFVSNSGLGLPPSPLAPRPVSALSPPRTAAMARRRRREVLGALALAALLAFLLARAWSPLWILQIAIDVALIGYAYAVYTFERPADAPTAFDRDSSLLRLMQPVLETTPAASSPGPQLDE